MGLTISPTCCLQPLVVNNQITVTGLWMPGQGTTARATDLSGNGNPLIPSGDLPALIPNATPGGGPAWKMSGSPMVATGFSTTRRGTGFAALVRFTSPSELFHIGSYASYGCSTFADAYAQFSLGSTTISTYHPTYQWAVLVGYSNTANFVQFSNGLYKEFASVPTDATVTGLTIPGTFSGYLGGLMTFRLNTPSDTLFDPVIGQISQVFANGGLWPVADRRVILLGNSLTTHVGPLLDSYPSLLESLILGDARVQSLAVPGATTPGMASVAPYQYDPSARPQSSTDASVWWEITNDLAFGSNALNGAATAAAMKSLLAASRLNSPGRIVIVADCIARNDYGSQATFDTQKTIANNSLYADFGVATSNARVFLANPSISYAHALIRLSQNTELSDYKNTTYFQSDGIHLTRAGNAIVAADVAAALKLVAKIG